MNFGASSGQSITLFHDVGDLKVAPLYFVPIFFHAFDEICNVFEKKANFKINELWQFSVLLSISYAAFRMGNIQVNDSELML